MNDTNHIIKCPTETQLTPDFDPSSVTVAKLRGILISHDVDYPLNAKKKALIDVFEQHVRPKLAKRPDSPIPLSGNNTVIETLTPPKLRKSKKRKPKELEEADDTNEKGNLFGVDANLEPGQLLPKLAKEGEPVKKRKKSLKKKRDELRKLSLKTESGPAESDAKTVEAPPSKDADLPILDSKISDGQAVISLNALPPAPVAPEPVVSNPTPVVNALPATTHEIELSRPTLATESPETVSSETVTSVPTTSADTAAGFDNALRKLRDETVSEESPVLPSKAEQEAELAKLLGVDIDGLKPKVKGRRSITPRRPIIVSRQMLAKDFEEVEQNSDNGKEVQTKDALEKQDSEEIHGGLSGSEDLTEVEDDIKETEPLADEELDSEAENHETTLHSLYDVDDEVEASPKQKASPKALSKFSWLRLFYAFLWIGLYISSLATFWYREQTFQVGFCGEENLSPSVSSDAWTWLADLGNYVDSNFRPDCVPCPAHARCFPNLEFACYDNFVKSEPWYFPYSPVIHPSELKCVPDTKKAEKIDIMINVALDLLRARNANVACGNTDETDFSAGISVSELHDLLLAMKAPYITVQEFEELWERSVVELEKEPEVMVKHVLLENAHGNASTNLQEERSLSQQTRSAILLDDTARETGAQNKVLRSTSLSHVSLKCYMSNTAIGLAIRYKRTLSGIVISIAMIFSAWLRYTRYRQHHELVGSLHKQVLDKLKRQARLARESSELPPYIGSIQLRDIILADEANLARRMKLWLEVTRKVERNSNVKHQLMEFHGEVMKVWQWISMADEE